LLQNILLISSSISNNFTSTARALPTVLILVLADRVQVLWHCG